MLVRLTLCIAFLIGINSFFTCKAQTTYKTAIGVKALDLVAVSGKHFIKPNKAVEGILVFNDGIRLTGLYEFHEPINDAPGLSWYIGPGVHVGHYNGKGGKGAYLGMDAVLGIDYKLKDFPLNFSLDWQPSFELLKGNGFYGGFGGFAMRVAL
ncbi:MAG: hypothetical protein ACOVNR_10040 [Chitinophagaceae bacterium]